MTTNDELEAALNQLANTVGRLTETVNATLGHFKERQDQVDEQLDWLTDAQLRFQSQLGELAQIFQARIEAQDRAIERLDQAIQEIRSEIQEIKKWRVETDQRFEILLAELRYLNQQRPPTNGSESEFFQG